ncbi:MAG: pacearchaeosortase [Candidatus Pacearchaeota archaeon]
MKWVWFFLRYTLAIISVILAFQFNFFYLVFKPVTFLLLRFLLSLFYRVQISGTLFLINSVSVELVDACVAGSAYLLLLLLNLLIPGVSFFKRVKLFVVSAAIFLVVNLVRLLISIIVLENGGAFGAIHLVFWYLSIVFVVVIWFLCSLIFKLKEIPIYSDLKFIIKKAKTR